MKNYFIRFFAYNNWANKAIIDFVTQNQIVDERIIQLASHVAHAQRNWYFRVVGQQDDVPLWTLLPSESIASQLTENGALWLLHLSQMQEPDFQSKLSYKNMAGEPFLDNIADILVHLVNHSTHHRGQIVHLIRGLGMTPPGTDFILFARQFDEKLLNV